MTEEGVRLVSPVQEILHPEIHTVESVPFASVPEGSRLESLAPLIAGFEATRPEPYRRRGTYHAADVASLIAWLKTNAPTAPVFAKGLEKLAGTWKKPELALIGIGNYSTADKPAWHDFEGRYDFPVSEAWAIWACAHGAWHKQAAFAEFIEDRIYDLSQPRENEELSEQVNRFLEHAGVGSAVASPSVLVELSRGLKLTATAKVETRVNLGSGEATLNYTQEHQGDGGRPIKVPQMFFIRIPVFFGTPDQLIGVRLRYRMADGAVMWQATMFAPDLIVASAFQTACELIRAAEFTLYLGSADKPSRAS